MIMARQKVIERRGLVLDDFLGYMDQTRKDYHLGNSKLGLKEIEERPDAKEALEKIVSSVSKQNGSEIYSHRHSLLSGIGRGVYSKKVGSNNCPRWRIRPKYVRSVVRALLERALQTLVHLPTKDAKQRDSTEQLRTLASHFLKLADEARLTLANSMVRDRIATYYRCSREPGKERLFEVIAEMQRTSETLNTICARTGSIGVKMDSPNPQVRFALYIVGWLDVAAGGPRYDALNTLLSAAFDIVELPSPNWIERLAIEKHSKRRRRMACARLSLKLRHQGLELKHRTI
jgi:hypothetical protein